MDWELQQKWPDEFWMLEWWSWSEKGRAVVTASILARVKEEHSKLREVKLPRLTLANVGRYIAAVSAAITCGKLDPGSGRALLYAAQLVITGARSGSVASGGQSEQGSQANGSQPRGISAVRRQAAQG